ncbi:protein KRI1 homolog [Quercus lobata]|uniref:Kri1-like C-terminal domain-containing protein n=1 Tax=Quercus lobata TaxID=97700 RepID=A0A7N2L8S3_QUELO|nr:protein KRI1 homolog [Quercus lobata]
MGLKKLFEGSDSENDDVSKISNIEVDEQYAKRYEHNKKRVALERLHELEKKGLIQSSDSSVSESDDDDDDFINSSKRDREFFDMLIKVKKQDPMIINEDVKFFESEESECDDDKNNNYKKKKAMYLKDVVAKQLIEEGPEFEEEDGEMEKKKSYEEEQEEIRRDFLKAAEAAEREEVGEEQLLRMKENGDQDKEEEESGEFVRKLDEYFGGDEEVEDEGNKFLKEFFRSRMWMGKEGKSREVREEELEHISEDEREIERQEEYEFRFQENVGDRVMGHSRKVEGSVRKKANARKDQRMSKKERMETARVEREEELKHLKNLKKEEMDEKVRMIMRTAGIREDEVMALSRKELEEEFDPEEYDRIMEKAFGEEYYANDDMDPKFGSGGDDDEDGGEIEKPNFEEDDFLGLPKGLDECGSGDGFWSMRERVLKSKAENANENVQEEEEEEEEEEEAKKEKVEEGKRKRKRMRKSIALLEKAKEAMMEEYYKLDYEDTIGDLKTRFKYAKIKPNRFGLSPAELLLMNEKELNQYVSLKKIVPYREEWKLNEQKRYQLKMRTKELLRRGQVYDQKVGEKKRTKDKAEKSTSSMGTMETGKVKSVRSNGDMSNSSRKAKRKRHQAEVKLSLSRLLAYGKIPSKSKSKVKH